MKFERGWLIGDPHLGKKFEVGVPAHRRGEREERQLRKFIDELAAPGDMVVMVGDLFDNPYVSHAIVKQAIDAVLGAALKRPSTDFVMMAGNHDMPRKLDATAAFSVFQRALDRRLDNLYVITEPEVIGNVAFFPWEWARSAREQVADLDEAENVVAAVGHWDLTSFGGEDLHLAPVKELRAAFGDVPLYSGHYHVPGQYGEVTCTGSLEPYSHAEDPEGALYVTMTLDEALSAPEGSLRDKCVRIVLARGEERPKLDALSVTSILAATAPAEQLDGGGATLDKFNWTGIVASKLAPLDKEVRAFIEERLPSHEDQQPDRTAAS